MIAEAIVSACRTQRYWLRDLTVFQAHQIMLAQCVRRVDAPQGELVAFLRWAAFEDYGMPQTYMTDVMPFPETVDAFLDRLDLYPRYWLRHLTAAAGLLGYKCHDDVVRDFWLEFYQKLTAALGLPTETEEQLDIRLS